MKNMFCYASFSKSYIPVSASPLLCALASGELIFCSSSPFGGISSRLLSCDPCPSNHTCYFKQSGKQKIFLLHSKTFHSFSYTQIIYNCMHTLCYCSAAAIHTHVIHHHLLSCLLSHHHFHSCFLLQGYGYIYHPHPP